MSDSTASTSGTGAGAGSTGWDPTERPLAAAPSAAIERGFFADLFVFAWQNKIWWIAPTAIILLALAGLVFAAQRSSIAPFFYALF